METLASIDGMMAAFSPAMRSLLWGAVSGAVGMGIYALVAPQEKLRRLQAEQKEHKRLLKAYDGDFAGLKTLIKKDLSYSLRLIGASVVPFILSMGPLIALMIGLEEMYAALPFTMLAGMEWTGNFEFWFLLSAIIVSLAIKFIFKIA